MKSPEFADLSVVSFLLHFLDEAAIALLAAKLRPVHFLAGTDIFSAGAQAERAWFLVQGRVVVKKNALYPGKYINVALLEDGALLGEAALLQLARTHSVTVTAITDSMALELTQEDWQIIMREAPATSAQLLCHALFVCRCRLQGASDRLAELL